MADPEPPAATRFQPGRSGNLASSKATAAAAVLVSLLDTDTGEALTSWDWYRRQTAATEAAAAAVAAAWPESADDDG